MRSPRHRQFDADFQALRELLLRWDPLGVGPEGPPDEYDDLALRLLSTSQGAELQQSVVEAWLGRPMPHRLQAGWSALAASWQNQKSRLEGGSSGVTC